ncbi:TonB-dependent receptor domain-containing protein [Neotabrizicola shimadae]|uniref:TonB-dependent receptor n=1 Tax=Neotabrizicola shimadae TaxID=2807096 RepID=A0A8G1EBZ7_9RHOB|nr:TonB-dependent receptor [Neotabrizicola shimadae]QYZ68651.1 TonB-dependent receptor [Neotabrizicola shimadae]
MTPRAIRPKQGLKVLAITTLAAAGPAIAQEEDGDGTVLDAIVVSDEEALGQAGGTGTPSESVIEQAQMAIQYAGASIQTILEGFAGVTAETIPGDPAVAVNIRGLQGDGRVAVTIDGARQNYGREGHGIGSSFYTDPEMLRSMEVVRGTASADASAGAIGGTLVLRTVTAEDLIAEGETQGGEARLRFGTLLAEPTVHAAWATQLNESATALLAFTRTSAANYTSGDGTFVEAEATTLSGLAKLSYAIDDRQQLTFSASQMTSDFYTGVSEGYPRDNDQTARNFILDYSLGDESDPWSLDATLYRTVTQVSQQLEDAETGALDGLERSYETATDGLRAQLDGFAQTGAIEHDLAFVVEMFQDNVTTDDPNSPLGSLTASGIRDIWSVYAEDAIGLTETTQATIGLRFDSYRLSSDDGSSEGTGTSPSLTISQQVGSALTLYATAAQAYRPPTLSESLVNGQHPPPATFYIRPNPDLKPESSFNQEIGATLAMNDLMVAGDTLTGQIAAYRNDVDDYIGLVRRGGIFNGYYQYANIDQVRIEGVELELSYDAEWVFASLSGQQINGTDMATGEEAAGIPPNRMVMTLGLRDIETMREAGARLTSVAAREEGELSTDAWQTIDLFFNIPVGATGNFGIALNNLTDEEYTQYLNTQPSPGFNALASLTFTF